MYVLQGMHSIRAYQTLSKYIACSTLVKLVASLQPNITLSSLSHTPTSVVAVEFTSTTIVPRLSTPSTLKLKIPRLPGIFVASSMTTFQGSH